MSFTLSENLTGPLGWFTRSKINRQSFTFLKHVSWAPPRGLCRFRTSKRPSHVSRFLEGMQVRAHRIGRKIFANFPLFTHLAFCRTEIPPRRFTNFSANEHPRPMETSGEQKSESRGGRIYRFSNTVDRTFLRIPRTFDLYHTRRGSQSSRISRRVFNLAVQPAPET